MNLISMKRTKLEKKDSTPEVATDSDAEEYPYGLSITLEQESLAKLGLDMDDFSLESKVDMICQGEITSLHENASKHNSNASVTVQITSMAAMVKPNEKPVTMKEAMAAIKR